MLSNASISANMTSEFLCDDELDVWMEDAWRTLLPLLISLGFAVAIEACMVGNFVGQLEKSLVISRNTLSCNYELTMQTKKLPKKWAPSICG